MPKPRHVSPSGTARLRLAAIVDASEDAIVVKNPDGVITSWSAGARRIFGYTEMEAVGQPITILIPPELRGEEGKILAALRAGERIEHYKTIRVSKSGQRINVSLCISPIKDLTGKIVGFSKIARDITGNTRAEEALRKSEERLRLAQWVGRVGTFEWNIQTGQSFWTPELEAIYGLPTGGHSGLHSAFENLLHPDDRARMMELTAWAVKTGEPADAEFRVVWPDGSVHWIAGRAQAFFDESGKPSRLLGLDMDITERKLAEEELTRTNERFNLAIEAGSVGGWDYDLKTRRSIWFGKAHTQLGMTPEETSGSLEGFWARVHKDDRERLEHALHAARDKHEEFAEDFRVVWLDQSIHWLRSRGRYHYAAIGEAERMLGISIDITEQKLVEEALLSSERRYRLLFERNVAGVAIGTLDGRVLDCNNGWARILGYESRDELIGRYASDFYFNPDERQSLVDELREKQAVFSRDLQLKRKDGSPVWVLFNAAALSADHGAPMLQATIIDISGWKRAEDALSEMTRKLIAAQEQERARIGRELHDDINQRLAMLSFELEQLAESPSDLQSRVQEVRNRIAEISNDVQGLSHDLHSSKLEYLGIAGGIRSWCKEFSQRHKMAIDFRSDITSPVPVEVGLSLLRVVQEASQNAKKHSGVKRIEVQLREESHQIHLVVKDAGRGFDLEESAQGTGLGLTSMRERVRLMNGTMSIDSKLMAGTTIHVRVPLVTSLLSQRASG